MTVPVISITDLSDPLDLLLGFALPEVELRAVITAGCRAAGVAEVTRLNAIFGRDVPVAVGPRTPMRSSADALYDVPPAQQRGIELLIHALADSPAPVHLIGSARPIAAALNRAPEVVRAKVARIHLSVDGQDPVAVERLVEAGLPLSLYPCTQTAWTLPDLHWLDDAHPWVRRHLGASSSGAFDVLDREAPADAYAGPRTVRGTAVWLEITGRVLIRTDAGHEIVAADEVGPCDKVMRTEQLACVVTGASEFELGGDGRTTVFVRDDPFEYEEGMIEALPALLRVVRPSLLS